MQIFSRFSRPLVSGLTCLTESKTSQEFKDEVNINNLLAKYIAQARVMGVPVHELLPKLGSAPYGDLTDMKSFHEMANKQAELMQMFEALPSDVRRKYGDTLEGFVSALNDDKEYMYLAEHGVLNPTQVKEYFDVLNSQNASVDDPAASNTESSEKSES